MPFVELEPATKKWVRVTSKSDGSPLLVISKQLRETYFTDLKAKVFIDVENGLLGIQPDEEGYRICGWGRIYIGNRLLPYRVKEKVYKAEWNSNHEMVVAKIEVENNAI